MMKHSMRIFICLLLFKGAVAQQADKWDLRKCVEYAMQNNISVRQADLQIRFAQLDLKQGKLAQYPSAELNSNLVLSSGRNQDPTSFSLITTTYLSNNYSLQASVDLFNWFTKKNTIIARDLTVQANEAGLEKAKKDVALNVAVAYLQVLLGREQINLSRIQVAQTQSQLDITRKQVDAGKLPELNAAQIEAQMATDSSNLISSEANAEQLLLQMKVLLNLDAAAPFDIETPSVEQIPIENLADLQPDAVYAMAVSNMPQQKADILSLKAAQKLVEVSRGYMYPTISMFGSLGTTYNNKAQEIIGKSAINAPVGTVTVGATDYQVFPTSPFYNYSYGDIRYFDQFNQNFRQSVGLTLTVPIANAGILRTAWQRSKLNVLQVQLQKEQNSMTLKQDIYKAYTDASAAIQKFNANKKGVETASKAYEYAKKRYDQNLLSTYDLLISQNTLLTSKSQLLYAQYDYVFKMKLLEFYKGQGLKL